MESICLPSLLVFSPPPVKEAGSLGGTDTVSAHADCYMVYARPVNAVPMRRERHLRGYDRAPLTRIEVAGSRLDRWPPTGDFPVVERCAGLQGRRKWFGRFKKQTLFVEKVPWSLLSLSYCLVSAPSLS